jgi:membrane protein
MSATSELAGFGRAVGAEFSDKNVTFLAGSIAYNAFVSLVPLLLFCVLAFAFFGTGWQDEFLTLATHHVSPMIAQVIKRLFQSQTSGAAGSSVFGLVVLVWSALKLFRGLDIAFSEIYEVDADSSFIDQLRDGLVVLVSLVFAAAAIIVATSAFSAYSELVPFLGVLLPVVVAIGLVVALFPMYYVFPNVDVSPRAALPGVVVAAVGWALLQGVFQIYVTLSSGGGTGLITGIMLLLTWLYFSGVVLLLGAVVNAVIEGYTEESVDIGEAFRSSAD